MSIHNLAEVTSSMLPEAIGKAYVRPVPAWSMAALDQIVISDEDKAILRYRLSQYHLAAIICAYGEPPKEISIFKEMKSEGGVRTERILAQYMYPKINQEAYDWLEAMQSGLDNWEEAGFEDPMTVLWVNGAPVEIILPELEDLLNHQMNRFRMSYDDVRATRLMRFMSRVMSNI